VRLSSFVSFELRLLLADGALGLFGEAIVVIRVACVLLILVPQQLCNENRARMSLYARSITNETRKNGLIKPTGVRTAQA